MVRSLLLLDTSCRLLTVFSVQFTLITLSWCSVIVNSGVFRLVMKKKKHLAER